MVTAFILIKMVAGHSRDVVSTLAERRVVRDVDRVTGPYDVIAVVEAADLTDVSDIVATEIHTLLGVERTITCISFGQ